MNGYILNSLLPTFTVKDWKYIGNLLANNQDSMNYNSKMYATTLEIKDTTENNSFAHLNLLSREHQLSISFGSQ